MSSASSSSGIRASTVGLAILCPLRWRTGSTPPSCSVVVNLFECQDVASGPVSASPSPTTVNARRLGLSKTAPYAWESACLLYTSDAADDLLCVDLGGRRI